MRRILPVILFLTLSVLSASAQTVQDAGYRIVGHIKSDGTIQDSGYKIVGHIKADGTVQDASYKIIGHIKSDGTVQDAGYRIVGHVKSDGTIPHHRACEGYPDEMGGSILLFPLIIITLRYEKNLVCRLRPLGVGLYPEDQRDIA